MKANSGRKLAAAIFWDVVTAGTHDKFRDQREVYFRLLVTSSLCIVGIAFLGGFGVLDTLLGRQPLGYVFSIAGLIVAVNYLHMRRSENFRLAAHVNVGLVLVSFLYLLTCGGNDNTGPLWLYSFPLVAQSLLGLRRGTIAIVLFLFLASVILFWPGGPFLTTEYSTAFKSRFIPTILVVVVISTVFEYIMSNTQRILIVRNERLSRTIDEVTEAQEALTTEKEREAQTLRAIGDGVVSTDISGRITIMNRVAEALTGWSEEEARGEDFGTVVQLRCTETHDPQKDPVAQVIQGGRRLPEVGRSVMLSRNGTERFVASSASPIRDRMGSLVGAIMVFRDVTGQARLEEELLNARKLEAIGLLAGGIAHDFNNILCGVLGGAQLARLAAESGEDLTKHLAGIESATHRAAALTSQLLTFSKGGTPVKRVTNIAHLIRETADFALSGSNVVADLVIDDDLRPVEVDEGQIGQVMSNLLINAKQAMPDGGVVSIRVCNQTEDDRDGSEQPRGECIRIDVIDQGAGIPEDVLPRVFDPYFTTKKGGSGLGLATTWSIVKKHLGTIHVQSNSRLGTRFRILLPASPKAVSSEEPIHEELTVDGGRILVVDDEPAIREIVAEMLSLAGCQTVTAGEGREALRLYGEALDANEPFDLVITDLTIPGGMGGRETIERLLSMDPLAKALVMSGYSDDPVAANFDAFGFRGFIPKPITFESLVRAVRAALAAPRAISPLSP